jgi:NAD(P)-dependent dehydrogenase (short-subunit alcohol dehydrogenase family)
MKYRFLPLLEAKASLAEPSRVIITASVAGIVVGSVGDNIAFSYSISKAAVIHLMKNLALALGPRHILCNAVAPGVYPSRMSKWLIEINGMAEMASQSPNRRLGKAEDIAGLVVFLSSRAASHLNGAVITTDGGSVLNWKM